jgi:hypothetical protein
VAASFNGGGNQRKPLPQVLTKLLSHNVVLSTPHHEGGSNSQLEEKTHEKAEEKIKMDLINKKKNYYIYNR